MIGVAQTRPPALHALVWHYPNRLRAVAKLELAISGGLNSSRSSATANNYVGYDTFF